MNLSEMLYVLKARRDYFLWPNPIGISDIEYQALLYQANLQYATLETTIRLIEKQIELQEERG